MSQETTPQPASARPNFPQMEEEIAAFWEKQEIFRRSIEERPESKTFTFYDGPPFATGLPHFGNLLQSVIKDAIPRYRTMQGNRVLRRWGWDCHGLPVENLIEKELKLNSKRDIESYGIDKFNLACQASVLRYASEWKRYVSRIGRWVDYDGAYRTMDPAYTESVWWSFAELWKKKSIYEDLRVSLYCPRCATPLSNFEIAMGNSYKDAEDPAVTVKFKVSGADKTYLLAWTTTPWTLPANVALAVHPKEIYVKVKIDSTGETYIFADKLMASVLKQFLPLTEDQAGFEVLEKISGADLVGVAYEPLYPVPDVAGYVARPGKTMYQVVAMDYVTTTDGTGIVHTAPAFGEEDFLASKKHDLPVIMTVDAEGRQKPDAAIGAGLKIKESDPLIIEDLRGRGLLYRQEKTVHSVAICWRCDTTLLYKAQPAWYVNVTKIKPKILDAAKKIEWHPPHFKDGRFGKGLETAPDWCISRTRYWGAPLPVWRCETCADIRVFGSFAEIEQVSKKKFDASPDSLDFHRPAIDGVTVPCPCGGTMRRIPEVFDCWYESGGMPFASVHYPFADKEYFDDHFPADFIAEAQDQTRGWFYSMHVLSTGLFNKPAFRNSIVTGLLMGEDGRKMSKSLRNYPDPMELMSRVGADAVRYFLLSSTVVQGESPNFSEKDVETIQRAILGTLWNVRSFYLMYAGDEKIEITKPRSTQVLDRWLMARLHLLTKEMTEAMDAYDLIGAARPLRDWVDELSTWWLRRSRDRIKSADPYERLDALRTLREALLETSALLAPFMPFFAERLYQDLEGSKMSVHLDRWPKSDSRMIDERLLADMQWVRSIATAGLEARAASKMPVRQALAKITVRVKSASDASRLAQRAELLAILREELNVEDAVIAGGSETGGTEWDIVLDTELTPELKKKGMVREISRRIMNLRKGLGLTPGDTVRVHLALTDQGLADTIRAVSSQITESVRASSLDVREELPAGLDGEETLDVDGKRLQISIEKS